MIKAIEYVRTFFTAMFYLLTPFTEDYRVYGNMAGNTAMIIKIGIIVFALLWWTI